MFFGYPSGIFEWDFIVVLSNILGVCILYSGYFSTQPLRKLHLSYPLSLYGLANLFFLALRLNNLESTDFIFDNVLTILLAVLSTVCTLVVLYYPNRVLVRFFRVLGKERTIIYIKRVSKWIQIIGISLVVASIAALYIFPSMLNVLIGLYVIVHYAVLIWFAKEWFNHPLSIEKPSNKQTIKE